MANVAITVDDVLDRFPQLEGNDDLIEAVIAEAAAIVPSSWPDEDQRIGQLYLVAHMVVTEANAGDGTSFPIASESLPGLSVSYAVPSNSDGENQYLSTLYGRRFWTIWMKNAGGGGIVVITPTARGF